MKIISHRGYWNNSNEKNSLKAFQNSFESGFGIETDIRDYLGEIVISHDLPDKNCILLENLFNVYKNYQPFTLALNIKSDGLQPKLEELIIKYDIQNYFVFDMSIPDTLHYLRYGISTFIRISEFEKDLYLLNQVSGVWLDSFETEWFDTKLIVSYINKGKKVCIVSSELHRRPEAGLWEMLKSAELHKSEELLLCTDKPVEAKKYFEIL